MHHGKWNHEKRETYETSMELEAELRRLGNKWIAEKSTTKTECMGLITLQIADRIKAARRREHKLLRLCARWIYSHDIYGHMSKELLTKCKEVLGDDRQFTEYEMQKPAPVGNSAAMREALVKVKKSIDGIGASSLDCDPVILMASLTQVCARLSARIEAALAAPPRNCDLPHTDEHELWLRWQNHCAEIFPKTVKFSAWLLAPANEKGDDDGSK